ncbi:MAG TPA: hypothetical protein VFU21_18440 [Kofleriaceae bacterium]|nr:hypothetical protein [Kofleriaceae bacterium]
MRSRWLLLALLLAACGRRASPAERRRVICMHAAIERGELPATPLTLAQLRDACGPALGPSFQPPPFGTSHPANPIDRWKHFVAQGVLLCRDDQAARLRPLQWQKLLAECGRDRFGVPAGFEPFFSESWYLGQRIGAWLAAQAAGSQDRSGWDTFYRRAGEGALPLEYPLSVPGLYTLPGSATSSFDGGTRSLHLMVLADRLLVGAPPRLRLVPAGVAPLVERFPGAPVAAGELAAALAPAPAPTLIAPRDLPAARLFEALAAAPQLDARILVAAQGLRAVVHRVPLAALDAARRAELAGKTVDELVRALDAIERARLGTPAPAGRTRVPVAPVRPIK